MIQNIRIVFAPWWCMRGGDNPTFLLPWFTGYPTKGPFSAQRRYFVSWYDNPSWCVSFQRSNHQTLHGRVSICKGRVGSSRGAEFDQSIERILGSNDTFFVSTLCCLLSNGKVFAYYDTMDVPSWCSWLVTQYLCSPILCFLLLHDDGCETRSTGNRVHFVYGKNTFHGS